MLKRKARDSIIIAVCVAAVAVIAVLYSLFANKHIFNESKEHLNEIYSQVNTTFLQSVDNNRKLLRSWENYVENSVNEIAEGSLSRQKEFSEFMQAQKDQMGFTRFYFIGKHEEEGEDGWKVVACQGIDGEPVKYHFRRSLHELLSQDAGGVVGRREGDTDESAQVVMFAVPIKDNVYTQLSADGVAGSPFEYSAIGILFNSDDMTRVLNVQAFSEQSVCYVALPDGNILLQSHQAENTAQGNNFFDYLRSDRSSLKSKSVDAIVADWNAEEQKAGTVRFKTDGEENYLTYIPVGFGKWMLVGVVPSKVVNRSMSQFRTVTVLMLGGVFVVVGVAVVGMILLDSKRRMQEKELGLRSRENLLELLTLNSNDIFLMFSPDTFAADFVSTNIPKVLGLDAETVRRDIRKVLDAAVETHATFTTEGLSKLQPGDTWETDIRMKNVRDGSELWYLLTMYHSVYCGKHSYVMMFSDRTKERHMSENLEQALGLAKSANEAKSNFLANMSHDIRTPMNAIIGFTTLLAKDCEKPDKVREYVRKIAFSGQHLLSLINDILDMSKIESGKTTLNIEEFYLPEFLEELYAMMAAQTKAKRQTFEVHTKGHLPENVYCDKLRFNQILLNLLSNAVKYTPEGGDIELIVEALDKKIHNHAHLRISVKDTGVGMSDAFLQTVFDPFARERTEATKEIQGTGLGMAITKNIVDLMGGTISVESELGKGSTFIVELELTVVEKDGDDQEFWGRHNITHVLVVDDEEDICRNVRDLMETTGVEVSYALSGQKAIDMVSAACEKGEGYNIILLDWKMPGMDGVETARRIRKLVGNDVSIMVLTSYSFEDIEEESKDAGIDYFLPKPFFVSNLRNAIAQIKQSGKNDEAPVRLNEVSIKGLKILAAEDNEINAEILTELLDIEEATCDIAGDGKQALEMFERSKPGRYDIIFMDVQMPIMDGYQATRAIRGCSHPAAKTIPIIAMTANAFDDDVKQALDSGMNAHLAKPIDMEKLKAIIAKLREEQNA